MTKFKLYNPEFEVELIPFVTPKIKAEIAGIASGLKVKDDKMKAVLEKMLPKLRELYKEEKVDLTNANELWQQAIKDGLISDTDIMELSEVVFKADEMTAPELINNDLTTLKMFKCLVYTKTLKDEQKELIDSEVDGDFWQSQNLELINKEVSGFCLKNAIRTNYYKSNS